MDRRAIVDDCWTIFHHAMPIYKLQDLQATLFQFEEFGKLNFLLVLVGNEGMMHDNPIPPFPSIPCVKRTSKKNTSIPDSVCQT